MSYTNQFSQLQGQLYTLDGLTQLDQAFCQYLLNQNQALYQRLDNVRTNYLDPESREADQIYIDMASYVEDFIARIFEITDHVDQLQQQERLQNIVAQFKRQYVQRHLYYKYRASSTVNEAAAGATEASNAAYRDQGHYIKIFQDYFKSSEVLYAQYVTQWLKAPNQYRLELQIAEDYGKWSLFTTAGQAHNINGTLFKFPQPRDIDNLIPETIVSIQSEHLPSRTGFNLSSPPLTSSFAQDQAHYCIKCHTQDKDSCRHGYPAGSSGPKWPGCPLRQKISQMNCVKEKGYNIGALAIITLDNPMVAATGQRICNDCVKACIFQKQDQVDIPHIETQILQSVLDLPYGFEIYRLLTQWNPLNFKVPLPAPSTRKTVLVVGLGPAGFSVAHYLLRDGHNVIGIDSCKIEPLPRNLKDATVLIKTYSDLCVDLEDRIIDGFGGVAEYGITVRWNKNYLKVIRLILERQTHFLLYDSFMMDTSMTADQAFAQGVNHIAYCTGAGRPQNLKVKGDQAIGVRLASDFLMTLQLGGAFQLNRLTSLTLRMPIVVIGGGLTAIDTAVEAQYYYMRQIEKFSLLYEQLIKDYGKQAIEARWTALDHEIAQEFLQHYTELTTRRQVANNQGQSVDLYTLLKSWGGTKVIYHRDLKDMQAYKVSDHELRKAMTDNIEIVTHGAVREILIDSFNHVQAVLCDDDQQHAARSVLIAVGTAQSHRFNHRNDRRITYFGDVDPAYHGSVVKALASAKNGYAAITRQLQDNSSLEPSIDDTNNCSQSITQCDGDSNSVKHAAGHYFEINAYSTVQSCIKLNSHLTQIVIHAPLAALNHQCGQFYRLQNYNDADSQLIEPVALSCVSTDRDNGLLTFLIADQGASSFQAHFLKPGQRVSLMGPCGTPPTLPFNEPVMLIGEDFYSIGLLPLLAQLHKQGCRVTCIFYLTQASRQIDLKDFEQYCYHIVWICPEDSVIPSCDKTTDKTTIYRGTFVDIFERCTDSHLTSPHPTAVFVNASASVLKTIQTLFNAVYPKITVTTFVNAPMFCMAQGLCGQCIHQTVDPKTQQKSYHFSCINAYQNLGHIDLESMVQRHSQNTLWENIFRFKVETDHVKGKLMNF